MRRTKYASLAAALALVLTSAGTSLSESGAGVAGPEPTLAGFDGAFQMGKSFTVTWGGSTDTGSGVASYSVTVRRAPFNGSFGTPELFKTDVLAAPVDPVVAAAGDIACGTGHGTTAAQCQEMKTADLLVQMNPAAVLPLGDTQYQYGLYNDYLNGTPGLPGTGYNPTWGRLKSVTRPAVGNHEYDPTYTPNAEGYFDYFNGPGNFTGPAGDRNKGYYSFDVGSWHLIALNSNCSSAGGCHVGSPQELWLRQDLAANRRSCAIAYMHHPRWSSDPKGGDFANRPAVQPFFQAVYDFGVELLLVGHSHFYERFAPQTPSQAPDPAGGVRQIITGTGGRSLYPPDTTIQPNSEVRDGSSYGVLKLTLHPKSYDWQFLPIAGQTFTDSGSSPCHGLVADTTPPTAPTMGGAGATGSATFIGEPGFTYCFQATATDWDGNTSQASAEGCTAVPVDNISFRHRGGWIKKPGTGHYLETFSQTKRFGATLTLTVAAKHLAIIVTKCPKCGAIDIFFKGKFVRRIRLRSSMTSKLRMIDLQTFDSVRTGTVKVRVVTSGKLVKVDGLGVSAV